MLTRNWLGFQCWILTLGLQAAEVGGDFQGSTRLLTFEEDSVHYAKSKPNDVVSRLQERLDGGQIRLTHDARSGYLPALLRELGISPTSQMLVFSKTSLQRERISPHSPRALYFNDAAYVGFIPGAPLIEISTADPTLGAVFYVLEQDPAAVKITRSTQCLECHESAKSMGVPGHLVRSFATDETGVIDLNTGTSLVTHRTPLADRWGGWFVTGTHGRQGHRGNLIGKAAYVRQEREPNYLGNLTDLDALVDLGAYPRKSSDIVALMVMEHQSHMHNYLTRLQYEATRALQQYGHINYLKSAIDGFVRYLLFAEETPLTEPLAGTSGFKEWFEAQGPRDRRGRSLRDFDLRTRVFKHPCSYLIYSPAFDALPKPLKDTLYRRTYDVLSADTPPAEFRRLSRADRRAVIEILADTKPEIPAFWRDASAKPGGGSGQ